MRFVTISLLYLSLLGSDHAAFVLGEEDMPPTSSPTITPSPRPTSSPTIAPSPRPTSSPTINPSPRPTSSPTITCPACSDCTHTTVILNDPHYAAWRGGSVKPSLSISAYEGWFDFQGSCDQIAVKNDLLEIQIRTRPRGSGSGYNWSGITQIVLRWKSTDEVLFHFDMTKVHNGNGGLIKNSVGSESWANSVAEYSILQKANTERKYLDAHRWQFLGSNNVDNYVQVSLDPVRKAYNLEINGHSSTFCGSNGMLGLWDMPGYYSEGPLKSPSKFTSLVENGHVPLSYAKAWQVPATAGEGSLLTNPSDICADKRVKTCDDYNNNWCEYPDGEHPGHRGLRGLQQEEEQEECDLTCDDIKHPLMRHFCELDVEMTGDTSWACQDAYLNPMIDDVYPPIQGCPDSCKGDATKFFFSIAGYDKKHKCAWAGRKDSKRRCALPEVVLNCCDTCCSGCVGDAAGPGVAFHVPLLKTKETCAWAAEDKEERCAIPVVARKCCETCNDS